MSDTLTPPIIQFSHVGHTYPSHRGNVVALDDVSLTLGSGEFVFLLGPSGCGKSSLLRLAAGLQAPSSGTVDFWGKRPKTRLVFQDHSLLPWLTVAENAELGLDERPRQRRELALSMLNSLGLDGFVHHFPHELSGGMKQRVAIARAFVTKPDILLMDEPLRTLDAPLRMMIQEQLESLWLKDKPTILFVTHDIDEALLLADRVVVMSASPGRILEEFKISLPRPRDFSGEPNPVLKEVRWKIWNLLKGELQQGAV